MSETVTNASSLAVPLWKRILFSSVLAEKSVAKRIAYIGVMAALCIATNMFEIKFATTQFSFTVLSSILAGILIGPLFGFCAVFLGDAVGYLYNSMGYVYYWWVALSVATMALIAGLVMNLPFKFKGAVFVKLAIICLLTFFVCSVGINTTGMYYIGLNIYFPKDVQNAAAERFGGEFTFWIYCAIRFFILGQIYNSILNYALLFVIVPVLGAVKPLKLNIK
ncbi:MAG: ECF transporter S component [Clostridia bacterium]|nr:ECF transporter S component [Clostridia bacterium]